MASLERISARDGDRSVRPQASAIFDVCARDFFLKRIFEIVLVCDGGVLYALDFYFFIFSVLRCGENYFDVLTGFFRSSIEFSSMKP